MRLEGGEVLATFGDSLGEIQYTVSAVSLKSFACTVQIHVCFHAITHGTTLQVSWLKMSCRLICKSPDSRGLCKEAVVPCSLHMSSVC
jgi:hypothetical protein